MTDENVKSLNRIWLIRSATRILGPFNIVELTEGLKTKQISLIDEIRQPTGRWSYVRENPMFLDIIRNIRDEPDEHCEKTMTQSILHNTITRTDALIDREDLTPAPASTVNKSSVQSPPGRDGELKDVTPTSSTAMSRSGPSAPVAVYGSSKDSRLQQKLNKKSNLIRNLLFAFSLILAVGVFVGLNQKGKNKIVGYEELISQAIRYKNIGLYEKSLKAYSKASAIREPDQESANQMALVLISEDRQSLLGRRLLEKVLSTDNRRRDEILDAYLGVSVSYIMDGELKLAEETLQKALGHEPYNLSALLNLAIIQFKRGKLSTARSSFEDIFRRNPQSVFALYGRAVSTIDLAREQHNNDGLSNLIEDIQSITKRTGHLRQELIFLQAYAQHLLGDVDGMNKSVVSFLNQLSGEARKYVHPLQVYWQFSQWDNLEKLCSEFYARNSANAEVKALRSICLIEVHRDTESAKLLQEALVEAPRDPYILATQANYFARTGRTSEAMSLLRMPELASLNIKNMILGGICTGMQDFECSKDAFTRLVAQDKDNVIAALGLAQVSIKNKDRAGAYSRVHSGLQLEPNYVPLLELRDQLESE